MIAGLRGFPVAIVSGLALGIDSLAHKTALETGIPTVAVPGSGLTRDVLYPRSHLQLAEEIVNAGGALLSEFENDFTATPWGFPQRNRIMAGMSHATLVIEAEKKSGTLITSRLATEYNRDVLTVPGSIFSKNSEGPHMLIRLGATPVTCAENVLEALGFETVGDQQKSFNISHKNLSAEEKRILELLHEPLARDELIRQSGMPAWQVNMLLSSLEIQGVISEFMGEIRIN
jgi:DNA processing protein